ncbi:hypothetical protein ACFLWV_00375 [Chloroflexota bacterium]
MEDKKKDESIKKLESEFRDFQKDWRKFLTNDFHHLVVNVDTLITQNDKQHDEIKQGMVLMQNNMEAMNQTVSPLVESTKRIVDILEQK